MSDLLHIPGDDIIRPRFTIQSPLTSEQATEALRLGLKKIDCPVRGRVIPDFASLMLPEHDREMWSPWLTVSIEVAPDGNGCLLRGVYGPAPGLWTLFMFLYTILGFSAIGILFYGLVLRTLGQPAGILWLVPVLIAIFLTLWLVAMIGQRLSRHQMNTLHRFVENSLGLVIR